MVRILSNLSRHYLNTQGNHSHCAITSEEVKREIDSLRSDCSTGVDQIPAKYIKLVKEDLAGPLAYIINTCIETSTFPCAWKTSRISPIPKIDEPVNENDFRPVSILPALSKVFERLVLKQVIAYIDMNFVFSHRISLVSAKVILQPLFS